MKSWNVMFLGMIAMACLIVGLFFVRFWYRSRDRFFLLFAASFFVEAINRAGLALSRQPDDGAPLLYVIRLVSFLMIALAILDKNRGTP
jgi:hypothetical protein